jgi:hypothetical protein
VLPRRHGVALCLAGGVTAASAPVLVADTGATELHANSALTEEVPRGNPVDLFYASERVGDGAGKGCEIPNFKASLPTRFG